ncbi:MAG TPA: response regulator [Pseudorhodoferax sp.]|jgi:DNA-binding NarL/FixJ family response regulator|nr:response regulator [Pseudorhodoferax sp.]
MTIKTVLVEDSKTIRTALIPTMAELGDMEVMAVAETAKDAIAVLHRLDSTWQLAVIDLFLRQGSGLDVLRACGRRGTGHTVIVLSNYATKQIRAQCIALGADAVFDKSTQLDAFFGFCSTRFGARPGT